MKNSAASGESWRKELNFFLGAYRASPHRTTGILPSELIFKFNFTSRLVTICNDRIFSKNDLDSLADSNDQEAKAKMKEYGDKK